MIGAYCTCRVFFWGLAALSVVSGMRTARARNAILVIAEPSVRRRRFESDPATSFTNTNPSPLAEVSL